MNEKIYAHALLYELDSLFDPDSNWSEDYQNLAYDIVKEFEKFEVKENAVEAILHCIERQLTTNSDWFAEFRSFLEQLDIDFLKQKYTDSFVRRPTVACQELLLRVGISESEIADLRNKHHEMIKKIC